MSNVYAPPTDSLPSSQTLRRWTIVALAAAATLVVVAVLPAERGIDPTGVGRLIGLTPMGEIKVALAKEFAAAEAAEAARPAGASGQRAAPGTAPAPAAVATPVVAGVAADTTKLTLAPNEAKEIKLVMRKGDRVTYSWTTEGGGLNYTTHGDTANAPPGTFHSYGKGTGKQSDSGDIVAVFDGFHGWYWRNRGARAVTVTLLTAGRYSELREMK